jgi:hypothetical protein
LAPEVDILDDAVLDVAELAPLVDDLFMSVEDLPESAGAEAAGGLDGDVLVLGLD